MNNSYYNPNVGNVPNNNFNAMDYPKAELPMEQSYVENILRLNKAK